MVVMTLYPLKIHINQRPQILRYCVEIFCQILSSIVEALKMTMKESMSGFTQMAINKMTLMKDFQSVSKVTVSHLQDLPVQLVIVW